MLLMLGSSGLLMVGLFSWQNPFVRQLELEEGKIAPFDIVAPGQTSYESFVLTERARQRAADTVPDQYDFNEGRVRRQQIVVARTQIEAITTIRKTVAPVDMKIGELQALSDLAISEEIASLILTLDDDAWLAILHETPLTLDRVMRDEIRESTLPNARFRVPMLVGGQLDEESDTVVVALVRALIRPNSFYNDEKTQQLRATARSTVPAQVRTYERGETIIRAGDRASADVVEAITQLTLTQNQWDVWATLRAICFTLLILLLVAGGITRLHPQTIYSYPQLALLVLTSTIWLLAAKVMIAPNPWLPYLFPLAALSMLISVLVDERVAVLFAIAFGLIAHFLVGNNPQIVVYLVTGALIGVFTLVRTDRLNSFLWSALAVSAVNFVALMAFRLTPDGISSSHLSQSVMLAISNGMISSGLALLGYFLFGNLFGITTSLQLNELSRPTHPLLRQLQLKAPGTYFHTILVSNMAERAAAAIGADALLTRVGAYYHDIGKTTRPYFFIENIIDGSSPHEKLEATTSAQIIISHVTDGLSLAQKYRLPQRIQDFIREHHGESLVKYFYRRAEAENNGEPLNEADFRYPGPSPRSKETAILLLADSCEAAVRARRPATREEMEKLIEQLIAERVADGELNHCNLTLHEVRVIGEVFQQVLQGVHHPRINYPESSPPKTSLPQIPTPEVLSPVVPMPAVIAPSSEIAVNIQNNPSNHTANGKESRSVSDADAPVNLLRITPLDEMA